MHVYDSMVVLDKAEVRRPFANFAGDEWIFPHGYWFMGVKADL
jgi:hypothetical protein